MANLQMWHNGYDFVICETAEEARALVMETTGCDADGADGDGWEAWAPDRDFSLVEADGNLPTGKRPVREWIEMAGRGYFASTEW